MYYLYIDMKKKCLIILCTLFVAVCAALVCTACIPPHRYSENWEYDAAGHWREVVCPHDVEPEKEAHSFEKGFCTVCGHYMESENLLYEKYSVRLGVNMVSGYRVYGMRGSDTAEILGIPSEYDGLPVVAIKSNALQSYYAKTVIIPNSVIEINTTAFEQCNVLEKIEVQSGNPRYVSQSGILYSSELTDMIHVPKQLRGEIVIADGVTVVDYDAFSSRYSITSVDIPESVTQINGGAFNGCIGLMSVTGCKGVTRVGISAFSNCVALQSISFTEKLHFLEENAFAYCSSLSRIVIPQSVEYVGTGVLYNCSALEFLAVPVAVGASGAFSRLFNGYLPDNLKMLTLTGEGAVPSLAFSGWISLESVVLSRGITGIEYSAFARCENLSEVVLQESLKSIGNHAFDKCTKLAAVMLPSTIESIGDCAFDFSGSDVAQIYYNGTKADWGNVDLGLNWYGNVQEMCVKCIDEDVFYTSDNA